MTGRFPASSQRVFLYLSVSFCIFLSLFRSTHLSLWIALVMRCMRLSSDRRRPRDRPNEEVTRQERQEVVGKQAREIKRNSVCVFVCVCIHASGRERWEDYARRRENVHAHACW